MDRHIDPAACVGSPRVHVTGSSQELLLEAEIAEDVRQGLRARGETLKDERFSIAAVQMVAWERGASGVRVFAAVGGEAFLNRERNEKPRAGMSLVVRFAALDRAVG